MAGKKILIYVSINRYLLLYLLFLFLTLLFITLFNQTSLDTIDELIEFNFDLSLLWIYRIL